MLSFTSSLFVILHFLTRIAITLPSFLLISLYVSSARLCESLFEHVFFADISESCSLTCVYSLLACECVHLCSYTCLRDCVHACVCLCCLFIWLSSTVFSVASLYLSCSLPSILPFLHFMLTSSPPFSSHVGVNTERPKAALLTPHFHNHPVQTVGGTWPLFKYFGNISFTSTLYNIAC